jgi:DHA1 family tetracycline resistance protein-like MFS transporter
MRDRGTRAIQYLFFTVFLDMLGIGILIPVIPQLFANPDSQYYLLRAGVSVSRGYYLLGLLTAAYPIATFFAAPILGQLSDRFGRKKILALCLFGTAVGYAFFALGIVWKSVAILFISRVFDGITGGNISVAQAAIADVTKPEDRAKNFGMIGLAFGLGFVFGPVLGGVLSDHTLVPWFSVQFPFYVAAGLALLNTGLILYFFKETFVPPVQKKRIVILDAFKRIGRAKAQDKTLRVLFMVSFLLSIGFSFFTSFFNVFLTAKFGFTQTQTGKLFAFIGLCVALAQAFVTRWVGKAYRDSSVLSLSYFATGIAVVCYVFPAQSSTLYFIVPFFAIFYGLTQANANALLSRMASSEQQGEVLGINAGFVSLAQAFPPFLAGFLAALFSPSIPILLAGLAVICAGVLFVAYRKRYA